jgi:hypothetical protein
MPFYGTVKGLPLSHQFPSTETSTASERTIPADDMLQKYSTANILRSMGDSDPSHRPSSNRRKSVGGLFADHFPSRGFLCTDLLAKIRWNIIYSNVLVNQVTSKHDIQSRMEWWSVHHHFNLFFGKVFCRFRENV